MDEKTLVFVYGTLRRGESNHQVLDSSSYLGISRTDSCFEMFDLGDFPGIVLAGTTSILGEIYAVDDTTLKAIDRLEDHPDFYQRDRVRLRDGQEVYSYVMKPAQVKNCPLIPSGDWVEYRKQL